MNTCCAVLNLGMTTLPGLYLIQLPLYCRPQATDIFVCDEESHFYSQCLEKLLVKNSSTLQTIVEFGSGDGTPVIACLMQSQFTGTIHGFELNKRAADLAQSRAIESQVSRHYKVSSKNKQTTG